MIDKEQHKEMIKFLKEKRIKPIEGFIGEFHGEKWFIPMSTELNPVKIEEL